MNKQRFIIEEKKPFSESLLWQINRDFYEKNGIEAWRNGTVPHHLTSNSMVGKTYAELIFAFLIDLNERGKSSEPVYILELGAGHGRLAFHILTHLARLIAGSTKKLAPYCYVLSDIGADNLKFFSEHPQFQAFIEHGILDVAYFDALKSDTMVLRHSKKTIGKGELSQPIIAVANYFFDSIPNDLFYIQNKKIKECWVALETKENPEGMDESEILNKIELAYYKRDKKENYYENPQYDNLLDKYALLLKDSHVLFPKLGFDCIENLRSLSKSGLLLITMDKGFHEIFDMESAKEPNYARHGSFSLNVNFHAMKAFCSGEGGKAYLPSYSTFHLQLGCFLFLEKSESYSNTAMAYQRFVEDFGPDDFFGMNKFTNKHIAQMDIRELIGMLRLGAYDSTLFQNVLPRIKQVYKKITMNERTRLVQTLHKTWELYFTLKESDDLAFEMGGIFYDLGHFQDALDYFQHSIDIYGHTPDGYYNQALCYYQLRQDTKFTETMHAAEKAYPNYPQMTHLRTLDLGAA